MIHQRITYQTVLALLLAILLSHNTNAFSVQPTPRQTQSTCTRLNAWSLQMPTDMTMFTDQQMPTLDTNWYTVSNPARRTVYEKYVPVDYTLMSAGTNWPSMDSDETMTQTQQPRHRLGPLTPLRMAARWARKIRG